MKRESVHRPLCVLGLLMLLLAGGAPARAAELEQPWPQAAAVATTLHVAPGGTDRESCGSASIPCSTIQYAVNRAHSGDTILVARGTYTYSGPPPDPLCRLFSAASDPVVCIVTKHLTVRGGYRAWDWSGPDPVAYPTIIDGEGVHRGIALISSSPNTPAASLHLEGLTIQNGLAKGGTQANENNLAAYGGGLYSVNSPVVLRNVVFRNNQAVGGSGNFTFGGTGQGGGVALHGMPPGTVCVLENVTFDGNQALGGTGRDRGGLAAGAGLALDVATMVGRSLTFTNNVAQAGSSTGGGIDTIYHYTADTIGGAISLRTRNDATLTNLVATGNRAVGGSSSHKAGAGVGGVIYAETTTLRVIDSWLQGNEAVGGSSPLAWFGAGGAIGGFDYNLEMERTYVLDNVARGGNSTTGGTRGSGAGGGLYLVEFGAVPRTLHLANSMIARNEAREGTGSVIAGGGGGGVWLERVEGEIRHTTFVDNALSPGLIYGSALLLQQSGTTVAVPTDLSYSIVASHGGTAPAIYVRPGNRLNLQQCLFAGNTQNLGNEGAVVGSCTQAASAGFVGSEDYHLRATSPAVGLAAGSVEGFDLDRQMRPHGTGRDAGADEYWPAGLLRHRYVPLVVR